MVNNAGVAFAGGSEVFTPEQAAILFDSNIIGFPMKVRIPAKLGFKNPKHVVQITMTNDLIPGFRVRQGYNWFSRLRAEIVPVQAGPLKCLNIPLLTA